MAAAKSGVSSEIDGVGATSRVGPDPAEQPEASTSAIEVAMRIQRGWSEIDT